MRFALIIVFGLGLCLTACESSTSIEQEPSLAANVAPPPMGFMNTGIPDEIAAKGGDGILEFDTREDANAYAVAQSEAMFAAMTFVNSDDGIGKLHRDAEDLLSNRPIGWATVPTYEVEQYLSEAVITAGKWPNHLSPEDASILEFHIRRLVKNNSPEAAMIYSGLSKLLEYMDPVIISLLAKDASEDAFRELERIDSQPTQKELFLRNDPGLSPGVEKYYADVRAAAQRMAEM